MIYFVVENPSWAPILAPVMLKAERRAPRARAGGIHVMNEDYALATLCADADAALENGADGDPARLLQDFRRDGIGRALALLENVGGVVDALFQAGGLHQQRGFQGEEEGWRRNVFSCRYCQLKLLSSPRRVLY